MVTYIYGRVATMIDKIQSKNRVFFFHCSRILNGKVYQTRRFNMFRFGLLRNGSTMGELDLSVFILMMRCCGKYGNK